MTVILDQFIHSLVESGLMAKEEILAFIDAQPADGRPADGKALAKLLFQQDKLTKFQIQCIYQGKTKGLVIGNYLVLDKIGSGGMGHVYKARHKLMHRVVALKVLPSAMTKTPEIVHRFQREVAVIAKLEHPNIVTAHDADEAGGVHFLVMQYVKGSDLAVLIREKGTLSVFKAVDYLIQAARGLDYAHAQGVIHRDIKPSNILLDNKGTVKILDMGLARLEHELGPLDATPAASLTECGQVMGTVDYMPPEQSMDTHQADHRADVYSLGCTLFYLLTGRPVFEGDTLAKKIMAHREQPIPSLRSLRPDVPEGLDAVFQKMVAKRPEDRHGKMSAVLADLEACRAAIEEGVEATITYSGQAAQVDTSNSRQEATAKKSGTGSDSALDRWLKEGLSAGLSRFTTKPAGQSKLSRQQIIAGSIMATVCFLVLLFGVVFSIRTPEGTLVVTVNEPDAEISVDDGKITLQSPDDNEPVTVEVVEGEHTLSVSKGGFRTYTKTFSIVSRGREALHVELLPKSSWVPETLHVNSTTQPPNSEIQAPSPEAGPPSKIPAWQAVWDETDAKAKALVAEQRFGEAEQLYQGLGANFDDLQLKGKVTDAVTAIQEQAEKAYQEIEGRVEKLSGDKKFAEARAAMDVVIHKHGIPANAEAAKKLLARIDASEEAARAQAAGMAKIEKQQQAEQRYAEAMKPIEELVTEWDFRGALAALDKVQFEEEELTVRVAAWREGVERLVDLKTRVIAAVNSADPPLKTTTDLFIRGAGRDVVKADEGGLTTKLRDGETEPLAWGDVGPQALDKLIELAGAADNASDQVAAGVLALASKDSAVAERHFEAAQSLGAEIGPYLATLASAAFARAKDLLDQRQFTQADAALANLEAKYAAIPWFAFNKQSVATAREAAKAGILKNEEAEKIYVEAARLLEKKELFDVKALVEQLKSDYAYTDAVRRRGRKPSLLDMEKAVADVPTPITVRLDGKGDFKSIQAAIDAAPSRSLIEIEDDGPYHEKLLIPKDKYGLRLRGKKGCWPVITSADLPPGPRHLVAVEGVGAFIERLVLLHRGTCLSVSAGDFRLRWTIAHGDIGTQGYQRKCECEESLVTGSVITMAPANLRLTLILAGAGDGNGFFAEAGVPCELEFCTILACVASRRAYGPSTFRDCIFDRVGPQLGVIENCALLAGDVPEGSPGCFQADPMFVDPESFDYRLKPESPCIGKASDGGDIGCRYTPEMIELCEKALELRRKGILKF